MSDQDEPVMNGEVGMQVYEEPKRSVQVSDHASIDEMKEQVQVIQQAMKSVMKQDEHFGTIPGTQKPTLLKPGAEKLSLLFRLAPEYEVTRHDMPDMHREYEVKCRITHINSGMFIGAGVGSCSTMEKKFRWRYADDPTGVQVPKEYWDNRDSGILVKAVESAGHDVPADAKISTTKDTGRWEVCFSRKVENPGIADSYNTVLKMAKKRAHVDAILTCTAASDIFTQDVEDMPEFQKPKAEGSTKKSKESEDQEKPWLNEADKKHWMNAEQKVTSGEIKALDLRDHYKVSKANMEYFQNLEDKRRAEIDAEFDSSEDLEGTPFQE